MSNKCEMLLCDDDADFIDECGNLLCEECMLEEIDNGDSQPEDFEPI